MCREILAPEGRHLEVELDDKGTVQSLVTQQCGLDRSDGKLTPKRPIKTYAGISK